MPPSPTFCMRRYGPICPSSSGYEDAASVDGGSDGLRSSGSSLITVPLRHYARSEVGAEPLLLHLVRRGSRPLRRMLAQLLRDVADRALELGIAARHQRIGRVLDL